MLEIVKVTGGENLEHVRELFLAYAEWVGIDLSFQNFDEELRNLPGEYAPPGGCLLLALFNGNPTGCVAVRKFDADVCEMKRLFVLLDSHGLGVGKALAGEIIIEAKRLGYTKMRLDTMPKMGSAQKLYRAFGFKEIEAYRFNPVEGTVFMELDLGNFQVATDLPS